MIKNSTTEQEHLVVITEQGPIVVYQAQSGTIIDEVSVPVLIKSVLEDLHGRKYIQDKDNHSLIDEDFDTADESGIVSETDHFSDDQGVEKGLVVVTEVTPPRGLPEPQFNSRDYMTLYTTIYYMCIQRPPHDYSEQLHDWYKTVIEDYIAETVLQSIQEKHSEYMLKELVQRWNRHKVMVRWLRVFHYLDRFFITGRSLPSLKDVGFIYFRDLVFEEIKVNAKDIVISFINQEREGEHIDGAYLLIKVKAE
ncbi:hypothetical protein IFM89_035609 [Coptis chinensis]|uniref:Cullin N-terminal domain-containing protein n=1 Tax=Coptis chinensis TaxID=261450 RepID=A0A835H2M0_9MAGN|nr:hypothetical protein IFM89_035609 [Coptis chinensis]